MIKQCPVCGKIFETTKKHPEKTYCSPLCVRQSIINRKRTKLIGKKFGRLLVTDFAYSKNGHLYWMCKCDCGNTKIALGSSLIEGHTKSCGCLQKENKPNLTHNVSNTRFYHIWVSMKNRCNTNNINSKHYKYYKNKGIKYCKKWEKFENFKNDMFESYIKHTKKYGEKETTLDRINGEKNYTKSNCRWATYKEQTDNRKCQKKFKAISPDKKIYYSTNQTDFAKKFNLKTSGIWNCLNYPFKYKSHKQWTFCWV